MVAQGLTPGVEDGSDPQLGLEVVMPEVQQGGRGTGKQEVIEPLLVVLDEWVQGMGQREHDMKIGDGQQVFGLSLHPLGPLESLASRTVPVATGMGHEVGLSAMGTLVLMAAQRGCAAGGNSSKHFPMMGRQTVSFSEAGQGGSHHVAQGESTGTGGTGLVGHKTRRRRLGDLMRVVKVDQIQSTADLIQVGLADVQINRCG